MLLHVTARAAQREPLPSANEPLTAAAPNSPAQASDPLPSLSEFAQRWLQNVPDNSFRTQLDARVLRVLAGEYEAARKPLSLVSTDQQQMASRFVEALIAIREGHLGDPSGSARAALREIESLADALRDASELTIVSLAVCREVRGFGQYTPIDPPQFASGAAGEFVLYCELRDFASRKEGDGVFVSRFDLRTTILSRAGDVVLEIKDPEIVDRCRNRRRDCFIPRLIRLPATLSPGEYVAKVTLVDKLADKVAEQQTPFRVIAR